MLAKLNAILKDKNTLIKWMISYALILAFSILIISLISLGTVNVIDEMVIDLNNTMLTNIKQTLDNKLIEAKRLALQISFVPGINEIKTDNQEELETKWTSFAKLSTDLSNVKVSSVYMPDFYIYVRNTDVILTPRGTSRYRYFYNSMHESDVFTYEEWVELLNNTNIHKSMTLPAINKNGQITDHIVYMAPLSTDAVDEPYAVLLIVLAQSSSLNINTTDDNSFLFIIDDNNNIITNTKKVNITGLIRYSDLRTESAQLYKNFGGSNAMISYISSDVADWKYVSAVPQSIFWGKTQYVKRITIISTITFLLLGILLIFIMSKKNYTAISNIEQENKIISEKLEEQSKALQQNFLIRFIKGHVMASDTMDTIHNMAVSSNNFCVILFYIEDYSEMFDGIKKEPDPLNVNLIYYAMHNIIEELSNIKHNGIVSEMDGMMVCLVNFDNEDEDYRSDILSIVKTAKEVIEKELYVYSTAAIGSFETGIDNINTSYKNALLAIEHRVLNNIGNVIEYDALPKAANEERSIYTLDMEYRFLNCVKSMELKKAETILIEIMEEAFSKPMSISMARCMIFDIVSTMRKAIDELTVTCGTEFIRSLCSIDNLIKCKTIRELKEEIIFILECADEHVSTNKKQKTNDLKENIINYVHENYGDINLSVASIADAFKMNVGYLSKFFKEKTGEGLLDFIHKTRVEEAKILLRDKNRSISSAAIDTGFNDSVSFIRVFKKYEGVTPGKYRERSNNN